MSGGLLEVLLIVALGLATYGLRIGGYLALARFERLDPRLEAALDAVPAAVIAALVAPVALATGLAETITCAVIVVVALRLPIIPTLLVAAAVSSLLRVAGL